MKPVHNKMCTTVLLRKLIYNKDKVKKVLNFVNYLFDTRPVKEPNDLPVDECLYEEDDVSVKSGPRQYWDDEDTKAIEKEIRHLEKCPSKHQIQDMSQKNEHLFRILEKEGFSRCYEKVKAHDEKNNQEKVKISLLLVDSVLEKEKKKKIKT